MHALPRVDAPLVTIDGARSIIHRSIRDHGRGIRTSPRITVSYLGQIFPRLSTYKHCVQQDAHATDSVHTTVTTGMATIYTPVNVTARFSLPSVTSASLIARTACACAHPLSHVPHMPRCFASRCCATAILQSDHVSLTFASRVERAYVHRLDTAGARMTASTCVRIMIGASLLRPRPHAESPCFAL